MSTRAPLVDPGPALSAAEVERYARQIMVPELGVLGQRRLKNARVLVIGAGGLGSPVLLSLAAAGVGRLGVVDDDVVESSNLQRQAIHGVADIGRRKTDSAGEALMRVNPLVDVRLFPVRLDAGNALAIFADYDLVVDGSDNFATRYLVNDMAALLGKPYVWGSVLRLTGQVTVFWDAHGPGYRDLYPEEPEAGEAPACAEGGVLGPACAAVGALMAAETIKLLAGIGRTLLGRLQLFDGLEGTWREVGIRKDPRPVPVTAQPGAVQTGPPGHPGSSVAALTVPQLRARLRDRAAALADFDLVDVREAHEYALERILGSINMPISAFEGDRASAVLPRQRDLVLYCTSGIRSARAVEKLAGAGYSRVSHLAGGLLAWTADDASEGTARARP